MVGKRTWSMVEIVWILEKWRDNRKVQELVEQYVEEFPKSTRNQNLKTLRTGIQYVWDKYHKDPSYNHDFSGDEIWFIMIKHHAVKGSVTKEFLKVFKETFPEHDWKSYTDELLAIEAAIAKHQRVSPYCIKWQHDEVCFVFQNKLNPEGWEGLFRAFQAWRNREEITLHSLQYLYASRQLEKYTKIDELEDLESCLAPSLDDNVPAIVHNPTKRKREDDRGRDESQNKRFRISPQQQLGANKWGNLSGLPMDGMSASIHQYVLGEDMEASCEREANMSKLDDRQVSNPSLLRPSHPQVPLGDLRTGPRVHFLGPEAHRHSPVPNGYRHASQPMHAQDLYYFSPTMPVSQKCPPGYLSPQTSCSSYPDPNITPQPLYSGWNGECGFTSVRATPPGNEQFSRGLCTRTRSRGATFPPNTGSGWSLRDHWNQNNFRPINHHKGPTAGPVTYTDWQESQLTLPYELWSMPGIGESQFCHTQVEDQSIQADLNHWQADLHSYENWSGPIPTLPDEISGVMDTETAQRSYPDRHAMAGQSESSSSENLLTPTSAIPGENSGTLGMEGNQVYLSSSDVIPAQLAFTLDGDWAEPPSMVFGDPLRTLGVEEHQSIPSPIIAAPQMQDVYLQSGNLQGKHQSPTEPENISPFPEVEDDQALQDSTALLGEINSYGDELWRTAVTTEPGGFEEFLFSNYIDLSVMGDFPDLDLEAPNNPAAAMGMGDHQVFKDNDEVFSEQPHLSLSEAVEELEATNHFNSSSFLGTAKLQISSDDRESSSGKPTITKGEDGNKVVPKAQNIESPQLETPLDVSQLFWSNDGKWMDPDLEYLSNTSNPTTECTKLRR